MSLVVYNTQTRKKEKFEPHQPPLVKMYCCGPTVYDLLHVGNFRGAIFYNLVRQWLVHLGFKVKMIYNYTDVDDKIINRAHKDGVSAEAVAEKYTQEFRNDFDRLKLLPHDGNPRVSETMEEIKELISDLIKKDKAYAVSNGDVWYSIRNFDGYGKLSNRNIDELKVGVRIEKDEQKHDPLDFALWKHAKEGEPFWESPWGKGRPGWHIECSAMAKKHLGEQIDIHGGGLDLVFPHHENEIAQSEGASGKSFAKYWMHNNLINFAGAKMSKSLGNIMTARSFMDTYNPEILKYLMLSSHYRSVSDLSEYATQNAVQGLARIYSALAVAEEFIDGDKLDLNFVKLTDVAWTEIEKSLNDDFNTPEAFACVFGVVREFNTQVKRGTKRNADLSAKACAFRQFILKFGVFMSLFQEKPKEFLFELDNMLLKARGLERQKIDKMCADRRLARQNRDFKRSDEIRDELVKLGIAVMDTPEGSFWEVAK
jgi:cysteinyl-tRNA synthetase